MKRLGKFILLLVLGLTLLVSALAVTAAADPVHIGGSRAGFSVVLDGPGGGVASCSDPVHIGGG